jgi:hypothetical protein
MSAPVCKIYDFEAPFLFVQTPRDINGVLADFLDEESLEISLRVCKAWNKNEALKKAFSNYREFDKVCIAWGYPREIVTEFRERKIPIWKLPTLKLDFLNNERWIDNWEWQLSRGHGVQADHIPFPVMRFQDCQNRVGLCFKRNFKMHPMYQGSYDAMKELSFIIFPEVGPASVHNQENNSPKIFFAKKQISIPKPGVVLDVTLLPYCEFTSPPLEFIDRSVNFLLAEENTDSTLDGEVVLFDNGPPSKEDLDLLTISSVDQSRPQELEEASVDQDRVQEEFASCFDSVIGTLTFWITSTFSALSNAFHRLFT